MLCSVAFGNKFPHRILILLSQRTPPICLYKFVCSLFSINILMYDTLRYPGIKNAAGIVARRRDYAFKSHFHIHTSRWPTSCHTFTCCRLYRNINLGATAMRRLRDTWFVIAFSALPSACYAHKSVTTAFAWRNQAVGHKQICCGCPL